jgi:hypothetical protein
MPGRTFFLSLVIDHAGGTSGVQPACRSQANIQELACQGGAFNVPGKLAQFVTKLLAVGRRRRGTNHEQKWY